MIRLFVTDIDGCLATPYQPYRLDVLATIRLHAREAGLPGEHPTLPAFSICSGRSYPYVEAMSQVLGLKAPALFESGAGLFDPVRARVDWHPELDEETVRAMDDVRAFMVDLTRGTELSVDLAKRSQVAVVAPESGPVLDAMPKIEDFLARRHPGLRIFQTPFSLDVVAPHLTKKEGVAWLASRFDLVLEYVAFVGDTDGDLGALASVGRSYSPANADPGVREAVDVTTSGEDVDGVLEAYLDAVQLNKRANRSHPSSV